MKSFSLGRGWIVVLVFIFCSRATDALALDSVFPDPAFTPLHEAIERSPIVALALQTEGKLLVGGTYGVVDQPVWSTLVRRNSDGTWDRSFQSSVNVIPRAVAILEDGKILVAGEGNGGPSIYRLKSDGTLDSGFSTAFNGSITSMVVQTNGTAWVGGLLPDNSGNARLGLVQFSTNGTSITQVAVTGVVKALALQNDGKILVGGAFTSLGGRKRTSLARLKANGSADDSFVSGLSGDTPVDLMVVLPDQKLLVGQQGKKIVRLLPDGQLDSSFAPVDQGESTSVVLQADGKALIAGPFIDSAGQAREGIRRILDNGQIDDQFISPIVRPPGGLPFQGDNLLLQPDGKLLLSGGLTVPLDLSRANLIRLAQPTSASSSLIRNGSTITWIFEPQSPALVNARFEFSTGGNQWTPLGSGVSIPGGWKIDAPSLPAQVTLRARGNVVASAASAGWYVEGIAGPPVWTLQPQDQSSFVGATLTLKAEASGEGPITYAWWKDGVLLNDGGRVSGANTSTLKITNLIQQDEGHYYAVAANALGHSPSTEVQVVVHAPILDLGFQPDAFGDVGALAVQADAKILVADRLKGVVRLDANGARDAVFNQGNAVAAPDAFSILENGSILVGGSYTVVSFDTDLIGQIVAHPFGGIETGPVLALATQLDGNTLVGGNLRTGAGDQFALTRILPSLAFDDTFHPDIHGVVYKIALQEDGKSIIGGSFGVGNASTANTLTRLTTTGELDKTFTTQTLPGFIQALAIQSDGKIVVAVPTDASTMQVFRFLSTGVADPSFHVELTESLRTIGVSAIVLQTDGKILIGGTFDNANSKSRQNLVRLNADGTVDDGFDLGKELGGSGANVTALVIEPDGRLLVAGKFTEVGGLGRPGLARLVNPTTATEEFIRDGQDLRWLRGGSSPEVWQVVFDASDDGQNWKRLGVGTRFFGGWELKGNSLPAKTRIRARGYVAGGWFAEAYLGAPVILSYSPGGTFEAGSRIQLQAPAAGTQPLTYRWRRNGILLEDGGSISGAHSASLVIDDIDASGAGQYTLEVSNSEGTLLTQPINIQVQSPGLDRSFSVEVGLAPYSPVTPVVSAVAYQRDGAILIGGLFPEVQGKAISNLARLLPDGKADETFIPQPNNQVASIAVQPNGSIFVAGKFSSIAGVARSSVASIRPDGGLDPAFAPQIDGPVNVVVVQEDGKVLVGGAFVSINGTTRLGIARLSSGGAVDPSFHPAFTAPGGSPGIVRSIAIQQNGHILVIGDFSAVDGVARNLRAELQADGSVVTNSNSDNLGSQLLTIALDKDGERWIAAEGDVGKKHETRLWKLTSADTIDPSFAPWVGADLAGTSASIALLADGSALFTEEAIVPPAATTGPLLHIHSNGTPDSLFNTSPWQYSLGSHSLAVGSDGSFVVARFGVVSGVEGNPSQVRSSLLRFKGLGSVSQTLFYDGSGIAWQRSGPLPEVSRTVFEYSTDGTTWLKLGDGSPTTTGWRLNSIFLPTPSIVRARGLVSGGDANASSWWVETQKTFSGPSRPLIRVNAASPNLGPDGLSFDIEGQAGQRIAVEASEDLTHWTDLKELTLSAPFTPFLDGDAGRFPGRYYRLRVQ